MKLKTGKRVISALRGIGISQTKAIAIAGKSCKPTGRTGKNFIQVEFDRRILKKKENFVFCVPLNAIA
jgi:hypothetical protein